MDHKIVLLCLMFIRKAIVDALPTLPLRRPKRFIFLGQGPVQGPREEVQGPCAGATNPENNNGCKGHLDMCKGHNSGK